MKKYLLCLFLMLMLTMCSLRQLPAQTVVQNWAVLNTGASPNCITIDALGNIYTLNFGNNTISKITPDGTVTAPWTMMASGTLPVHIVTDVSGTVYTANYRSSSVSKITATVLPVSLISFNGRLQSSMANFKWQTGVEDHLNHFELQTGTDGKAFSTVAMVDATGSNSHYTVSVPQTAPVAYYRLKMENNNTFSFSETITLSEKGNGDVSAYPNPAKDDIMVKTDHEGIGYIYNGAGLLVKAVELGGGMNKLDIRSLPTGIYFIVLGKDHIRFIKQ